MNESLEESKRILENARKALKFVSNNMAAQTGINISDDEDIIKISEQILSYGVKGILAAHLITEFNMVKNVSIEVLQ